MSKKQLLTEGEIRRFMKYANLGPLSENFLSENIYEDEGDMPPGEGEGEGEGEGDMGDMLPPEEEGDMEGDMPAPQGNLEVEEDELAGLIERAVQKAVAAAMEAAGLGGGEAAPKGDMGDMDDMDDMGDEEMEEGYGHRQDPVMDEDRMVSEVARRVMARLSESRKPQARPARAPARRSRAAAINEVTDRIMKRILKGK